VPLKMRYYRLLKDCTPERVICGGFGQEQNQVNVSSISYMQRSEWVKVELKVSP
jgi:hypothetical protein